MHGIVTFVAKYFIVLAALILAGLFLKLPAKQKKNFILAGVLGALFSLVLAKLGSHWYYDPRPFVTPGVVPYFAHAGDNGFPSDHTLLGGFFAFLAFRYSKKSGWVLLVLAVLIGLSRVVAHVHHLADIIGSLVFAAVGVGIASWIVVKISSKKIATN